MSLLAWLVARVLVGLTSTGARVPWSFNVATFVHWDAYSYAMIAAHGTTFGHCGAPGIGSAFTKVEWCGHAAWLPGYPEAIKVLVATTELHYYQAGIVVAAAAAFGAILALWACFLRTVPVRQATLLLCAFALFPGCVYSYAPYPVSLALLLTILAAFTATKLHFGLTALLIVAAGLCYPTAWFSGAALALGILVTAGRDSRAVLRRVPWAVSFCLAPLALMLYDQLAVHRYDAYFVLQNQPGARPPGWPGVGLFELLTQRTNALSLTAGTTTYRWLAIQAIVVLAVVGASAVTVLRRRRRGATDLGELYLSMISQAVVLGLLFEGAGSWHRVSMLAAPCIVSLRHWNLRWQLALLTVFGVLAVVIGGAYFGGTLT